MTEKTSNSHEGAYNAGRSIRNGWERLKKGWNSFWMETRAEAKVVEGVVKVATNPIKEDFNEKEGNIFQKIAHVASEGWNTLKTGAERVVEKAKEKGKEIKDRYEGLSVGVGAMAVVHDAVDAVAGLPDAIAVLPAKVNRAMGFWEGLKWGVLMMEASTLMGKEGGEKKLELLMQVMAHVQERGKTFYDRAEALENKVAMMKAKRTQLPTSTVAATPTMATI